MSDVLLEVKDLHTYFELEEGTLKAVNGVSFSIRKNRTLGIVGESGCGKSVTAQSIMRITPQTQQQDERANSSASRNRHSGRTAVR